MSQQRSPQEGKSALTCATLINSSEIVHSDSELNTRGLLCPEPLMLLRNHVRELKVGQVVHIVATDPSTDRDFSNFCRFMGHELLHADVDGEILEYWIKKGGE